MNPSQSNYQPTNETAPQPLSFVRFLAFVQVEQDGDRAGEEDAPAVVPFEPWPHLMERAEAWQAHTRATPASEAILKARQLGISTLAEAYALYIAEEKHGNVLVISKTGDDSKDFGRKTLLIYDNLPESMKRETDVRNTEQISFVGGGRILLKAPTEHAGRSQANTLVIVDEAAFQQWAAKNYKAYRPTISAGGQLLVISTANGASGWFHSVYWKSKAQKMPYRAVFIPWSARPDRDATWLAAERAAFEGSPDDFAQEYPNTEAEAFIAKTGLVYPQFAQARHMREADPVRWEDCVYRVASADYGGGDPTAVSLFGVYKGSQGWRVHGFGLFYRETGAVTVDELFSFIGPWHDRAPLSAGPSEHDATVNASLSRLCGKDGLFYNADKSRGPGLGNVAMFLEKDWLTFNAAAFEPVANEFASYRWLARVDSNDKDRYATATPVDHHGDVLDTVRYALMFIFFALFQQRDKPKRPRAVSY